MMKFNIGDTLIMKKNHPCGSNKMKVMYTGSDVKIRCEGCSHDTFVARAKLEKNIKQVISGDVNEQETHS